ncbi:MAG: hypothetical protein BMS9Abin18_0487 [Zetaproteobacteria bacterium]|nr:MAG: hypothetical protein BMS9Abin18_0487 [Zetaproteobacteria bacterium]
MTDLSFISAEELTTLFNLLIVTAIGGLWIMWARASRRQKRVEALLIATSEQLDEASRHLEESMSHIQHMQRFESHISDTPRSVSPEPKTVPLPIKQPGKARAPKHSPVTAVLRMHREGYSPEDIAASQDIELAKVKLMLKLHERQAA